MTVIKLRDGGLLLHSPVFLDSGVKSNLDALGPVRFVIAPNRFHHLFAGEYRIAYPEAKFLAAPGLDTKRKDIKFDATLDDNPLPELVAELDQVVFRAFPPLNEVVFFHRASRTVIFTDLLFNVKDSTSAYTRLLMKLDGGYGHVGVPRSFRLYLKFRRSLVRTALDRILSWDFDRLSVTHGEIIERDAKAAVAGAWANLR